MPVLPMPLFPVRKKTTDPKLAAEQAAVRAFELAVETGSLTLSPARQQHPMPPRRCLPSSAAGPFTN